MKHALEMNSGEQIVSTAGYIPLKDKIKMMTEAGRKLVEYRAASNPSKIGEETVDVSLFGKRYYDKIDLAIMQKRHSEKLSEMQAYKAPKHKAKAEETKTADLAQQASEGAQEASQ